MNEHGPRPPLQRTVALPTTHPACHRPPDANPERPPQAIWACVLVLSLVTGARAAGEPATAGDVAGLEQALSARISALEENLLPLLSRLEAAIQAYRPGSAAGAEEREALREELRAELAAMVDERVRAAEAGAAAQAETLARLEALERSLREQLQQERAYRRIADQALILTLRERVPAEDVAALVDSLERLAAGGAAQEDIRHLLEPVAGLAYASGAAELLARIERSFRTEVLRSPETVARLARFHGERLAGGAFQDPEAAGEALERFRRHVASAYELGEAPALMALHLIVESVTDDPAAREALSALAERIPALSAAGGARFIHQIVRYTNPHFWPARGLPFADRLSSVTGKLVDERRELFSRLLAREEVQREVAELARHETIAGRDRFASSLRAFGRVFSDTGDWLDSPELKAVVRDFIQVEVAPWLRHRLVIHTLRERNRETRRLDDEEIRMLDMRWRTEEPDEEGSLIRQVTEAPLSRFLRQIKLQSAGLFKEVFIMDAAGLVAGTSDPTSDYWQGDEAKWQQTYAVGPEALHVGPPEFDQSVLSWQMQISLTINDPLTLAPIGAATVGVDAAVLDF